MIREGLACAALAVVAVIAAAGASACVQRPRMCAVSTDCAGAPAGSASGGVACVAGRCQPDRANVKPAIDAARRVVIRPVDAAFVRRGEAQMDDARAMPAMFALGRDGATLLLRFDVALSPTVNVVEAYVVLHRETDVDDDPAPIVLHATRIVEGWSGRSTSWAFQPRIAETRAPSTTIDPAGPSLVRLDVRDLVRQWARRDPDDQGIAIVADNESRTGTTFAYDDPYLELYLR